MSQTTGFAFSDQNTQNGGLKYTYTKVFYHKNFSSLVTENSENQATPKQYQHTSRATIRTLNIQSSNFTQPGSKLRKKIKTILNKQDF